MTFAEDDNALTLTVTFNDVQYALVKSALNVRGEFERLLMNHLQMVQDRQKSADATKLQTFLETATPDQKAQVLDSITTVQAQVSSVRIAP